LESAVQTALQTGSGYEVEVRVIGENGAVRWIAVSGWVLRDDAGAPLRLPGTAADVSKRRRAAERERLLADAGELLASSLDIAATLEMVAKLAVPRLADWCVVDLLEADGQLHRLAIVHRDPAKAEAASEMKRRYSVLAPTSRHTIWETLHDGRPRLDTAVVEARFVAEARDPEHLALLRGLGFAAEMVVPLVARGRSLGALTFVLSDRERRYETDDLSLAEELARRCALALDNARLYRAAREAEAAARASEARYRAIVETTNEGVWLLDAAARTLYANDRMVELLGTTTAGLTGRGLLEFVHPQDEAAARERIDGNLQGRDEQFDVRFRRADGGEVSVLACTSPMRDGDGQVVGALGMFSDVTERRQAEEALSFLAAASGELSASLELPTTLENLARSVVPALADWCVVDVVGDGGYERLAAVHRDPDLADKVEELCRDYPPDPTAPAGVGLVLQTGTPAFHPEVTPELALATARNDPRMLELLQRLGIESYVVVPLIAREEILGAISLVYGRSGRRHDARALALANELARRAALAVDNARLHGAVQAAVQQRDEFLAITAHDLKNPLTVIQGRAQSLRRHLGRTDVPDLPRLEHGLSDIQATATKMGRLISELQDLAAVQAGQLLALDRRPLDLVELAREEVSLLAPTIAGHHVRVDAPEAALMIEGDAARLARVLANLLGNAIKFSPNGGAVVVGLGCEADGWAVLTVADEGLGIPPADLPRIFDRFYRGTNVAGRIPGSGIGLAGAKQIVEQHGGTIAVASQSGRGSTFTVRLPLLPAGSAAADAAAVASGEADDR
jgi:PAS domain S-box-containing protein